MVRSIVLLAAAASLLVGSSEAVTAASHRIGAGSHPARLVRRTNPQEHTYKGYCKPRRNAVNQGNSTGTAAVVPQSQPQPQPQLGSTVTVQLPPLETMPTQSEALASSSVIRSEAASQASVPSVTRSSSTVTLSAPASSVVGPSEIPSDAAISSPDAATTEYVDITSFVTVTPSSTTVEPPTISSLGSHSSSGTPSSHEASSSEKSSLSSSSSSASSSPAVSSGVTDGTSTNSSAVTSPAVGQTSDSSHGSPSTATTASSSASSSTSTSSSSTSLASNASSTTLASPLPASSTAAVNSTALASSSAPASFSTSKLSGSIVTSSTASTAAPSATSSNGCPAGTSYKVVTDDFTRFDGSKWTLEAGAAKLSTFSSAGLTMQLDEQNQFIVYQSISRWAPPTKMSVGIQSSSAPGIVSAMTFLAEAGVTDEIDLELIEGSWQVPMWHSGHRLEFGRDVEGTLTQGSTSRNLSSWVYDDSKVVPFAKVHEWEVDWKKDSLQWSADGRKLLDIKKLPKGNFVTQTLPVRFGPWVAGSWAGQVDWKKNPNPSMKITKMTIQGCQAD